MATVKQQKKVIVKKAIGDVAMYDASKMYNVMPEKIFDSKNPDKCYPTLYFDTKQVPQIKVYEVGDTCLLHLEAVVVGHNINESGLSSNEDYRFEIHKVGITEDESNENDTPEEDKAEGETGY